MQRSGISVGPEGLVIGWALRASPFTPGMVRATKTVVDVSEEFLVSIGDHTRKIGF